MKYEIRKETECGWTIYSVYNSETGNRVNYFATEEEAQAFIARKQRIITDIINDILSSRMNVIMSWGLHNKRAITDGVRFDVQGFKFTGEVKITFDFARSHANKKSTFKVQIGDDVSTGITAENLIDFIDERVEKVDNYEEEVKASMTPEEFAFAQSVGQVIFI